jgi:hypothetical protein
MVAHHQAQRYDMVAASHVFDGCEEPFVTSVLALLRCHACAVL